MYDKESNASSKAATLSQIAPAAFEEETSEAALVSLHQLRSAVVELSTALDEALRDDRGNAVASLQRATAMLHSVGDTPQPKAKVARQGLAPWQVRRVLAYIEENLGATIRNSELAAIARLSTFHFSVAFRNSIGEAPHEHVIRRRVERAQGMMLSTKRSLSDIAAECGMADQAHLTRLFRKIVGDSPAAWRRARADPQA